MANENEQQKKSAPILDDSAFKDRMKRNDAERKEEERQKRRNVRRREVTITQGAAAQPQSESKQETLQQPKVYSFEQAQNKAICPPAKDVIASVGNDGSPRPNPGSYLKEGEVDPAVKSALRTLLDKGYVGVQLEGQRMLVCHPKPGMNPLEKMKLGYRIGNQLLDGKGKVGLVVKDPELAQHISNFCKTFGMKLDFKDCKDKAFAEKCKQPLESGVKFSKWDQTPFLTGNNKGQILHCYLTEKRRGNPYNYKIEDKALQKEGDKLWKEKMDKKADKYIKAKEQGQDMHIKNKEMRKYAEKAWKQYQKSGADAPGQGRDRSNAVTPTPSMKK